MKFITILYRIYTNHTENEHVKENSLDRTRDSVDASVRVESVCIVLAQHRPRFVNHGANFAVEMRDNAKKTRHLRDYSGYGHGQWEEALYSNTSHWLSPHAGWSLHILEWLVWFFITPDTIDPFHKSHNASYIYPTMHHFVTEMCTHVHISVTKWCIVGYRTGALWDLRDGSICRRDVCKLCPVWLWMSRVSLPRYVLPGPAHPERLANCC